MSSIEELTQKILDFRNARDWKKFHAPKELALSLMVEAAEVGEIFQWKTPEEIQNELEALKGQVGKELADVLYATLLLANDMDINLSKAFDLKMEENELKYPTEKFKGSNRKYSAC